MRRNTAVAYCALLGLNQTIMIPIAPASMRPGQLAPEMAGAVKHALQFVAVASMRPGQLAPEMAGAMGYFLEGNGELQ